MKNLENEFKEVIEKNLPSAVAGTLQEYLKKARDNEQLLEMAQEKNEDLRKKNIDQFSEIERLKGLVRLEEELTAKEETIAKREQAMEIATLKIKLEESEKRQQDAIGFVGMVFKSPIYRKDVHNTKGYMNHQGYNGENKVVESNNNMYETVTEE